MPLLQRSQPQFGPVAVPVGMDVDVVAQRAAEGVGDVAGGGGLVGMDARAGVWAGSRCGGVAGALGGLACPGLQHADGPALGGRAARHEPRQ